jgi:aspartyl-tRNA(Asn)/glutamyl-tRNA(Gln) amidotransferase subunit A
MLKKGEISSYELTRAYIDRIEKIDPKINSFILKTPDLALKQARAANDRIKKKENLTPLTGIPIALKDIFITKDVETTCGSKILKGYIPPYSGTAVQKLLDAGTVLLGKLNMDEFAMGSSNEHSAFGPVKNPWNSGFVPGGSSGGSTAAVAADLCAASLGTDTGGSVRQPSSCCSTVGLKPTYGRVSRYGIIAFASSLDQVGPITKDVTDSAIMMNAIAGHDSNDATSIDAPVPDYTKSLIADVKGLTIGVPKEYFVEGIDSEVSSAVRAAEDKFKELGANCIGISLPHTKYAVPTYYIIAPAECSANLARYDGIRFGHRSKEWEDLTDLYEKSRTQGFGPEVTLRIIVGTYVLSSGYYDAYYLKAQKVRTLIKQDFFAAFKKCDAILTPVMPTPPFKLGEKLEDPLTMYLSDIFTIPVNLAGLPIGLQLIGKPLDEQTLIRIAFTYEQATDWHKKKPPL